MIAEELRSNLTLDLWVRSITPTDTHAYQDSVITRLERLDAQNRIADYTVHVWGKHVARDTAAARTDAGAQIVDRIDTFRTWADRTGMSLDSFFVNEEVKSLTTDEGYEAVTVPMLTLAEYEDGSLQFVAPCSDGETLYTVTDRLDALDKDDFEGSHDG